MFATDLNIVSALKVIYMYIVNLKKNTYIYVYIYI